MLSGLGIGGLAFGLSVMGLTFVPSGVVAMLLGVGAASSVAYVFHARRAAAPILDLNLFKFASFRASIFGGFLFRLGIGALPFLLPLLLQIGFNLTPFESGLITFTSALGAMFMKAAVARVLRRFGFRPVLVYNSIISGAFLAACASFVPGMPFLAMVAILLIGGFFRSLQFTSVNTLAYAEIEPPLMSRATTIVSVVAAAVALDRRRGRRADRRDHPAAEACRNHERRRLPAGIPGDRRAHRCLLLDLPAPSARRRRRAFRARQRAPPLRRTRLVALSDRAAKPTGSRPIDAHAARVRTAPFRSLLMSLRRR